MKVRAYIHECVINDFRKLKERYGKDEVDMVILGSINLVNNDRAIIEIVDCVETEIISNSPTHVKSRIPESLSSKEFISKRLSGKFIIEMEDSKGIRRLRGVIGFIHSHPDHCEELSPRDIQQGLEFIGEWIKSNDLDPKLRNTFIIGLYVNERFKLYTIRDITKQIPYLVISKDLYSRYVNRVKEYISSELLIKEVAIIGVGTAGSQVAYHLSKLPIGRIKIFDEDIVEPENLCRQMYGVDDIGKPKVHALAETLRQNNPLLFVDGFRRSIQPVDLLDDDMEYENDEGEIVISIKGESTAIADELRSSDLIVVCADNTEIINLIDAFAYKNNIPVIHVGFGSKVLTGYIFVSIPPYRACAACLDKTFNRRARDINVTLRYGTPLSGAQGLFSDTSILCSLAARIALKLLRNEFIQYNLYTLLNIHSIENALEYGDLKGKERDMLRQIDLEQLEQIKRAFNVFRTGGDMIPLVIGTEVLPHKDCPIHRKLFVKN